MPRNPYPVRCANLCFAGLIPADRPGRYAWAAVTIVHSVTEDISGAFRIFMGTMMTSDDSPAKPYVLGPGEGVPGFDAGVKASRLSTGGGLTLIESITAGGAPWHVHTREDEYFYVVEG